MGTSWAVLRVSYRLRAQSSTSLPKTSNPKYKELGSNYKLRQKSSHKTIVTSGTNCKFRGFPEVTLRSDNLLAGFTELVEAIVLMTTFIIGKG